MGIKWVYNLYNEDLMISMYNTYIYIYIYISVCVIWVWVAMDRTR